MVTETDLELGDGRTLHAYHTGADDADGRFAVFWHHGSPNIGAPPSHFSHTPNGSASAGYRTTAPATVGRPPAQTGTWRRRPPTPPQSPTLWASTGSRSWAIPAAVRTPWRAPRCFKNASWVWSSWPGWPRSAPRGSTGSKDSGQLARPSCAQRQPDALRWRSTWPSQTTSRSSLPKTKPLSPASGRGSSTWSIAPSLAAWEGSSTMISPESGRGASTPPTSPLQLFSCTDAGIGSCPPRTASGWRAIARRQNCDCTRMTGTSRFSTLARQRPWADSGSAPKGAELRVVFTRVRGR